MLRSTLVVERPVSRGVGWAAAQLKEAAGLVKVTEIERDLSRHLPEGEFFFPAITDEQFPSPLHPLSAYVFVLFAFPDSKILKLQNSRYVEAVLRHGHRVARVADKELTLALRARPTVSDSYEMGQFVVVLSGDWSGLEGRIAEVRADGSLVILIELRSTKHVVKLKPHEVQRL